jgi:hypothetical protein
VRKRGVRGCVPPWRLTASSWCRCRLGLGCVARKVITSGSAACVVVSCRGGVGNRRGRRRQYARSASRIGAGGVGERGVLGSFFPLPASSRSALVLRVALLPRCFLRAVFRMRLLFFFFHLPFTHSSSHSIPHPGNLPAARDVFSLPSLALYPSSSTLFIVSCCTACRSRTSSFPSVES